MNGINMGMEGHAWDHFGQKGMVFFEGLHLNKITKIIVGRTVMIQMKLLQICIVMVEQTSMKE